jgi:hypothetical protein
MSETLEDTWVKHSLCKRHDGVLWQNPTSGDVCWKYCTYCGDPMGGVVVAVRYDPETGKQVKVFDWRCTRWRRKWFGLCAVRDPCSVFIPEFIGMSQRRDGGNVKRTRSVGCGTSSS